MVTPFKNTTNYYNFKPYQGIKTNPLPLTHQ